MENHFVSVTQKHRTPPPGAGLLVSTHCAFNDEEIIIMLIINK